MLQIRCIQFSTDVNVCLNGFCRLFKSAIDIVAPVRDIRVKQKENPWMNSDILARIKQRDNLFSRCKKERSNTALYRQFCKLRNAVQRDVKFAKQNYFRRKIDQNKGDSGKLWKQLSSLGYSNKGGGSSNIVLEEGGTKVFEAPRVANMFNRFYTSVAASLVNALPSASGIFSISNPIFRQFHFRNHTSFTLSPVSLVFVRRQLLSLNSKKAVGLDGISSRFLKDGVDHIVEPIIHIINMSILTEVVPDGFKSAKVVPLFKKGSRLDAGNYRPVSILPVLSKLLERAVNGRLKEFLERNGLIYENQSGFRSKYSTDSCTIGLTDFIKKEITHGNAVGMVLIDLAKAFDTVDHDVLIEKMRAMGITSLDWFRSYLSQRSQCVAVNGTNSDFMPIVCGVPQGSILGPLLFLIYINDLHVSVGCKLSLYADDSALIFSHKSPNVVARTLSDDLSQCKKWLIDNKLSLHVGKTECILFGSRKKLKGADDFQVTCDGQPVKRVTSVKYLGLHLDSDMKGITHANSVIKKCAGRISFLYRYSSQLDFHCRKILCSALITPCLDYCSSSWYSSLSKSMQSKLDVLQRRMIRFIFSLNPRDHVGTEKLRELSWLSIKDRVQYFKLCHVFKIRNGLAPKQLSNGFTLISDFHSHNTRGSSFNYAIKGPESASPATFVFTAIKHWNALPSTLKESGSLPKFREKTKEFLLSSY